LQKENAQSDRAKETRQTYTDEEITGSNIVFHDEFDAEIYDWKWGKRYGVEEMQKVVSEYRNYLKGELGEIERYLDVGCGTGTAVVNLSLFDGIKEAHGSDISMGMLKTCRKNAGSVGAEFTLTLSDAQSLPYRDSSFDFITCHAILHHVPHPEAVMKEVFRLLRPGGRALVFEPTRYGTELVFKVMRYTWGVPYTIREWFKGKKPIWVVEEQYVETLDSPVDVTTFHPDELREIVGEIPFAEAKVTTYGFLSNFTKFFAHSFRKIKPIMAVFNAVIKVLTRLDDGILKKIVPESLYFQAVIYVKK
jgi:SAM-dependent methyltransferase